MGLDLQTPTVGDLARAWLDSVQQCVDVGTRSAHTFTAYEKAARLGIGKWFADVAADSVRPVQVQKMANAIRDERGPAIANQCVYAIRQAYAFASNSDLWVGACPAANIRKFAQKHRRHPLEADAGGRVAAYLWEAFLRSSSRHVVTEVQAAYFLTLLGTGLRRSEVSHLHRAEWDRVSQRITITEHKCSRTRGPKVVEGVGAAVVLDAVVERDWHGHWFFPSARAKRGHIENPERAWHRLRKAADVPEETRIHDIRHGFIASAFAQCGDLKQCQTLVQHSSIATTSRYVGDAPRSLISPLAKSAAAGLMGGGR